MNFTCPCCHSTISLEAIVQDDAARELQMLLVKSGAMAPYLVSYLGLFRSKSRALAWGRALKLAREVLEIGADPASLAAALAETVEAIRRKREQGQVKPLSNHNYLKQVLETVGAGPCACPDASSQGGHIGPPLQQPATAPRSKRAQGMAALEDWGRGDWLREKIADGLSALLALGLDGTPGADVVTRTADVWHHVLVGICTVEALDAGRVKEAFSGLLKTVENWPEPSAIRRQLPARPQQKKLQEPPPTAEEIEEGKRALRELQLNLAGGMSVDSAKTESEEERRNYLRDQARQLEKGGGQ